MATSEDIIEINLNDVTASRKRRRVGMACQPCRSRKVRCDGTKPRRSMCLRNGTGCTYQPASQMVNVSKEYIIRLKQNAEQSKGRKANPSQSMSSVNDSGHYQNRNPSSSRALDQDPFLRSDPHSMSCQPQSNTVTETSQFSHSSSGFPKPVSATANGVVAQGLAQATSPVRGASLTSGAGPQRVPPTYSDYEDQDPDDFYGDSSSISFMQAVQNTVESSASHDSASSAPAGRYRHAIEPRPIPGSNEAARWGAEHSLPQRSTADELVECYFRHVHILYPFLHKPSFMAQYAQTWTSTEQQTDQWLATLNVVFALGIHYAWSKEDRSAASARFFINARKLVPLDHYAHPNLGILQLLLLSALYNQSTSRPNQNWNIVGLAIRIATSIGAHVNPSPSHHSPIQIELRRRCWYGCMVLDTVLGLGAGRPMAASSKSDVALLTDLDDEYITEGGYLPPPNGARSKTSVFIRSIAFCVIMKDVLYTLYPPTNPTRSPALGRSSNSPEVKNVLSLDQSLTLWYQDLPPYLKAGAPGDWPEFLRARNVLLARFLNLRILIHRPIACSSLCVAIPAEPLYLAPIDASLQSICRKVCRSAAVQLVVVISTNFHRGLSSASWIDMNYLFTAGTVLLAMQNLERSPDEAQELAKALDQSLEILHEMQDQSSMARSYVTKLERAKQAQSPQQDRNINPLIAPVPPRSEDALDIHVPSGMVVDEYRGIDQEGSPMFPWTDMQDLFVLPWDMMVDDAMPTF